MGKYLRAVWHRVFCGDASPPRLQVRVSRFQVEMANARIVGKISEGSWLEKELLKRPRFKPQQDSPAPTESEEK
jgi:hypothetical protein